MARFPSPRLFRQGQGRQPPKLRRRGLGHPGLHLLPSPSVRRAYLGG
ncbi:hypothetical protein [Thermus sp.]|nr:hypothetical protein [Thermus sp.]